VPFFFPLGIGATVALVAGVLWMLQGLRDLRLRRVIRDTPTARIRSMPMGLVEVHGTAEPRSTVTAPFSGRECACWQVEVASKGEKNTWNTIHRGGSKHPFYLRDDTGVVLVDPRGAELRLVDQLEEECLAVSMPDFYSAYLREHCKVAGFLGLGTYRFRERLLEAGQRVFVLGTAVPRAQSVAVSWGDESEANGTDDRRALRLKTLDAELKGVLRRGENDPTYLISQKSERDTVVDLGWQAAGRLVGAPVLVLIGLGYWCDVVARWLRHS
jgi:hypothetical protein